jgi:hypothetical protein
MNLDMMAEMKNQKRDSALPAMGALKSGCKKCPKEKAVLQRAAVNSAPDAVSPMVHEVLRSPGRQIDRETRTFQEPGFGIDFSNIKVSSEGDRIGLRPSSFALIGLNGLHEKINWQKEKMYMNQGATIVQSKLAISEPSDKSEQEADLVAEQVMQMQGTNENPKKEALNLSKDYPSKPIRLTPGLQVRIDSMRSGGQPLPESIRTFFEPRFGFDFSRVRVHASESASETARMLNARAFAINGNLAFGQGQYSPETNSGRKLLAHELTHIVQQSSSSHSLIQRDQLHLYDSSDNALRRWGYAVHYCEDYNHVTGTCNRDKPGKMHAGIRSVGDVGPYIRLFKGHGRSIDSIYFHTHGAPGYIHLPDGGITAASVWGLNPYSGDIDAGATIGFLGCNVAEGQDGTDFLLNAGSSLLMNGGGRVFASDSVTFSVPVIGQRRPIWSSIKVVSVVPGGNSRLDS